MTEPGTDVQSGSRADESVGMSYLSTLPQRLVTLYLPLSIIMIVLLFPFYWMTMTAIKPKEHLLDLNAHNPFWTLSPTLEHIQDLLFKTDYPLWLWNTMFIAVTATILSIVASVLAAYAITRIRYRGAQWVRRLDLPRLPGAALDPVHPAVNGGVPIRAVRTPFALISPTRPS
jgi:ABC-type glycerol-3-phosphate transport system permease component